MFKSRMEKEADKQAAKQAERSEARVLPPRKKKRRPFFAMWKALKRTCTLLGAMMLFSLTISIITATTLKPSAQKLPDYIVLHWELKGSVLDHPNQDNSYGFGEKSITIGGLTKALYAASQDKRVHGLVLNVKGGGLSLSHIEELKPALKAFKDSGAFTYVYAPAFDSVGSGLGAYYLASSFDKIYMQPHGMVSIPGIYAEIPFARDALDKIGVQPEFFARKEYKNVFSSLTDKEQTPAQRKAMTVLVQGLAEGIVSDVAGGRGIPVKTMASLVDQGLFLDQEALDAGLVDELIYITDLSDRIRSDVLGAKRPGDTAYEDSSVALFVNIKNYIAAAERQDKAKKAKKKKEEKKAAEEEGCGGEGQAICPEGIKAKVALIYVMGGIVQTSSKNGGDGAAAADDIVKNIVRATEDESVTDIVVRVISPGGSAIASETIRHALVRAQENGKRVVVSMGEVAASGGYWVSASADYIFASPSTITGSIGVAGGKVALKQMWNKLGISWDSVQWGDNAALWSFNEPWGQENKRNINRMLDDIYETFIEIVSEGREMSLEKADRVARGRVWTGRQALKLGLVDELGGLDQALDYVAKSYALKGREDLDVMLLPAPKTPLEQIIELLEGQVRVGQFVEENVELVRVISQYTQHIDVMTNPQNYTVHSGDLVLR